MTMIISSSLSNMFRRPAIAVFDPKLRDLRLPVISASRMTMSRQRHVDEEEGEEADDEGMEVKAPRKEAVAPLAHQYFQWIGDFECAGECTYEPHTSASF
jgi:hypothetical protein